MKDYAAEKNNLVCLVGRFDGVTTQQLGIVQEKIQEIGKLDWIIVMPDSYDGDEDTTFIDLRQRTILLLRAFFPGTMCILFETISDTMKQLNPNVKFNFFYGGFYDDHKKYKQMMTEICFQNNFQISDSHIINYTHDVDIPAHRELRKLLHCGDIERLNILLGREFCLQGPVVHGLQNGRKIGFPTANILTDEHQILPEDGVYAVQVGFEGRKITGMANIGCRPTFNGNSRSVEVNIFNFDMDIYECQLELYFYIKIRGERKFSDIGSLKAQIDEDKIQIEAYFS